MGAMTKSIDLKQLFVMAVQSTNLLYQGAWSDQCRVRAHALAPDGGNLRKTDLDLLRDQNPVVLLYMPSNRGAWQAKPMVKYLSALGCDVRLKTNCPRFPYADVRQEIETLMDSSRPVSLIGVGSAGKNAVILMGDCQRNNGALTSVMTIDSSSRFERVMGCNARVPFIQVFNQRAEVYWENGNHTPQSGALYYNESGILATGRLGTLASRDIYGLAAQGIVYGLRNKDVTPDELPAFDPKIDTVSKDPSLVQPV